MRQDFSDLYNLLTLNATDLFSILDEEGRYKFVGSSVNHILGFSPEELEGTIAFNYIHADDQESAAVALRQLKSRANVEVPPFRFLHKDGSWRWMKTCLSSMLDNPYVEGIVANSQDITPIVDAEKIKLDLDLTTREKLRLTENFKKIALVADKTSSAALITDDNFRIEWVNQSFTAITGYTFEDSLDRNPAELLGSLVTAEKEVTELDNALREGRSVRFEVLNYKKDGSSFWNQAEITPIFDEEGKLKNTVAIFNDITYKKEAEARTMALLSQSQLANQQLEKSYGDLKLSNERYRIVSDMTSDAIWDWDLISNEIYWSDDYFTKYGYDVKTWPACYESWLSAIHPDDRKQVARSLDELFVHNENTEWESEYRYFNMKLDSYSVIIDRGVVIRDSEGRPLRMVGAMQDVTTVRKKEAEILEQNKKLSEIAFYNSHKVRKPIANILGLLGLLKASGTFDPELINFLELSSRELDEVVKEIAEKSSGNDI